MKQETKELFDYLRASVKVATSSVNSGLKHFQTSEEKVIKQIDELEDKLKKMEVYLTKGGIILDRNNNKCHAGDKVKIINLYILYKNECLGTLVFDDNKNGLTVRTENNIYLVPLKDNIELIEHAK